MDEMQIKLRYRKNDAYHNDTHVRSGSADPEYASNCEIFLRTTGDDFKDQ